jgi:hypothetical protein
MGDGLGSPAGMRRRPRARLTRPADVDDLIAGEELEIDVSCSLWGDAGSGTLAL